INHDNVVKLHNVFDSKSKMCLIVDLLEGGELFDRIVEQGYFTEKSTAQCFGQLVVALDYLHQKKIVHRDLKPENLLFSKKCKNKNVYAPEEWNIKLIDFGLAGSCKDNPLKTACGTPNYVAPEILRREKYGAPVDMWSSGVILYIMLCGFPPFYDEDEDMGRLYQKIRKAEYDMPKPHWNSVSDEAKDLVRKLLAGDPTKRATAAQTLQHPWLQGKAPDKAMTSNQLLQLKRFQYVRKLRVYCFYFILFLFINYTINGAARFEHKQKSKYSEEYVVCWLR
ncbi:calcium/calmodulin-dependent protein kinase IV, partial [Reticulomyxa filosa]